MQIDQYVGPTARLDGPAPGPERVDRTNARVVTDAHGRFYEANYRGALYSGGMGLTSISNATYTTGTLGPTVTPIAGVYNPIGSIVNLVILQVALCVTETALQATGGGPYAWATSITTTPVTTGNAPLNRKTLQPAGSAAKDITNVAPTGLSPNLAVRFGSSLGGGSALSTATLQTAAGFDTQLVGFIENFDGSLIVPPGGVLALLATTTPVAHSAVSAIFWEEVAL